MKDKIKEIYDRRTKAHKALLKCDIDLDKVIKESMKCKKCGSKNIVMVEYGYPSPEAYDGISEIDCKDCDTRCMCFNSLFL